MDIFVAHPIVKEEWIKLPSTYDFIFKKNKCEYTPKQEELAKKFRKWCFEKFGDDYEIITTSETK